MHNQMHDQMTEIRRRIRGMMPTLADTLGHILKNTTEEQGHTLRDGPEGWTILEVLCHLRDFDTIFRERAQMMLTEDYPDLPDYDHEALAIERRYNDGELAYAFDEYYESRKKTIAFFQSLSDEDWTRSGVHPERGHFTMLDAALQVCTHDVTHLEQITRILEQEEPGSGALPSEKQL